MKEQELQDIWKNNLRKFNDVMRLDSIIIRAMDEAVKKATSKQLNLSSVSSNKNDFEKELFELINGYCKKGLKKPELVKKMEWVLGSCKMS
jgi:hypothetical protein